MVENVTWIKTGLIISVGVSVKIQKIISYFWNPPKCSFKNGMYGRRIGDLVVMCDQIIEEAKTIPTKSTLTKTIPPKTTATNLYILLAFLLITIASLITISIYLAKHWSKQKHLLLFHNGSKLKEIDIKNVL